MYFYLSKYVNHINLRHQRSVIILLFFFCTSFINVSVNEGYINGVEDVIQVEVKTNESPVYGIFQWDDGLSLWVRVYGQKKKLHSDVDLSNVKSLILQGKGKFLLELHSQKGKGHWKCRFVNEKEYKKMDN